MFAEGITSGLDPIGIACLCFGTFILVFGLYSRVRPRSLP
jgi:hypothetical protein